MQPRKIRPFLWFDTHAEEAAKFYCSLFPQSRVLGISRYPQGSPMAGTVMTVEFVLGDTLFVAFNGGPHFKFSEAISLAVDCADQVEVDFLWHQLCEQGGTPSRCGWLKDRWGLSWQIVPRALPELLASPDPTLAQRVLAAMMGMSKIEVALLQRAAAGAES